MNPTQKACATCRSFDPVHGCWDGVSLPEQADAPQSRSRPPGPDDCCDKHQTQRESDAQELALYALWQPLLIKSRWARTRGCKSMQ